MDRTIRTYGGTQAEIDACKAQNTNSARALQSATLAMARRDFGGAQADFEFVVKSTRGEERDMALAATVGRALTDGLTGRTDQAARGLRYVEGQMQDPELADIAATLLATPALRVEMRSAAPHPVEWPMPTVQRLLRYSNRLAAAALERNAPGTHVPSLP